MFDHDHPFADDFSLHTDDPSTQAPEPSEPFALDGIFEWSLDFHLSFQGQELGPNYQVPELYDPDAPSGEASPDSDAVQPIANDPSWMAEAHNETPDSMNTLSHEPMLGDYYGYSDKAAYDQDWKDWYQDQKVWNES